MLVLIAVTFWTQSRIPALNEKAQVGDRINISAIAFDVVFPVLESQPLYERAYKAAINWGYTNWKGMTFGFLLAAALITLLQLLPKTLGGKNRFLNSLLGLGIGSPLGVCVNCATPVAQGMIHAGARLETSLAMLLSSPTLNPIVLAIAFSLLPLHLVLIKILLSLIFILLLVPLLVTFSRPAKTDAAAASAIEREARDYSPHNEPLQANRLLPQTWFEALCSSAVSYLKNLLYILKITLPLMLVAGLSGSLLIEALPAGSLSSLGMQPLTLVIVAAIGVFLPVPIAFDVLIVNILISSGLNIGLASSLLFSLGIFSIYPALVIGKSVSVKLSALFFSAAMIFAIFAGVTGNFIDKNIGQVARASIENELRDKDAQAAFKAIIDTCGTFAATGHEATCLRQMLLSNALLNNGKNICTLESTENPTAVTLCHQVFAILSVKQKAVAQQDMGLCQTLTADALIDECKVHYIRAHSLEYTSLDACAQIDHKGRRQYCRYSVIGDRITLKTAQACELGLSADLKRQCLDNLDAHIASEFGDLNKCKTLTSSNAQTICRSTVTSLKITNLQEYTICKQLNSTQEASACQDRVVMHQALQAGNAGLCVRLSNQRLLGSCQINAVIRKHQVEVEKEKLLAFDAANGAATLAASAVEPVETSSETAPVLSWSEIYNEGNVSLAYIEHRPRAILDPGTRRDSEKRFRLVSGDTLGLTMAPTFNLTDFMEPFLYGKGIASGDFNNDGWPDLVFASSNGLQLYKNTGAGSFGYTQHIGLDTQPLNAFVVTFVDIDNDGWQDLFLTAYGEGSYFFKNIQGHYSADAVFHLPANNTIVALAAGFSDWDKDGDLDLVLGHWSYGAEGAFIPEKSQNVWYNNNKLQFIATLPNEPPGETLSILLSDINGDGNADLLIGNDRKYPDMFYLGDEADTFSPLTNTMQVVQSTSLNTMSYDSADFNNDLLLDIFSADMSVAPGVNRNYCDSLAVTADKKECEWLLQGSKAVESLDVGWCAVLKGDRRAQCYTAMAIRLAKRDKDERLCDKVSSAFPAKADLCRNISRRIHDVDLSAYSDNLKQHESNKLLLNTLEHGFVDATDVMGVKNSYWGWTGKAADLDNDGWQDIYIGNGIGFGLHSKNIHSNVFYHNQKGLEFTRAETEFGLTDYTNTPSYTYVDFDLDGDIDIVSAGVMSTPSVFVNQGTSANSISFVMQDYAANRFCIGCKVIIEYAGGQKSQIRELKLSGGFMSYDAPVVHFGIADNVQIEAVKIIWSSGESWKLQQALPANRRYKITRSAASD